MPYLMLTPRMLAMTSLTPRASVLRLGNTVGLSMMTLSTSLRLSLRDNFSLFARSETAEEEEEEESSTWTTL